MSMPMDTIMEQPSVVSGQCSNPDFYWRDGNGVKVRSEFFPSFHVYDKLQRCRCRWIRSWNSRQWSVVNVQIPIFIGGTAMVLRSDRSSFHRFTYTINFNDVDADGYDHGTAVSGQWSMFKSRFLLAGRQWC